MACGAIAARVVLTRSSWVHGVVQVELRRGRVGEVQGASGTDLRR